MPKIKEKFYEYIESSFNNKDKFECDECNEADKLMFKVIRINTDTTKPLEKSSYNLCRFDARLKFPYYFRKAENKKVKQESLFEVNV